jgi:hypothetical protein
MYGPLTKSLASWRRAHGFGVLCALSPLGEYFSVLPSKDDSAPPWCGNSETDLRAHLKRAGRLDAEIDEAIELSREWATTVTEGLARRTFASPGFIRSSN